MKNIHLFDDFLVHRDPTIERRFHTPAWIDEAGYSDPVSPYGMGYPSVVRNPEGDGFRLYYIIVTSDEDIAGELKTAVALAESDDGIMWRPKRTGRAPKGFPEHIVLGGTPAPSGCGVFDNTGTASDGPRYLMTNAPILRAEVGIEKLPAHVLGSDNGLDWSRIEDSDWLPHHSDTCNAILYNPIRERYQITHRRRWGERRVYQTESADLQSWSEPHPILHPSPADPAGTHFYGMPTFALESGIFLGLLWHQRMPYNDVMGGPVVTEYTYSYDGALWNRTHVDSIPNREPGQYGGGSMYAATLIEHEDETIVYTMARIEEHHAVRRAQELVPPSAVLLPGRIRKNGFVGLRSTRGVGEITTECLLLEEADIRINIVAPLGGVRAQLTDGRYNPIEGCTFEDSIEITGDHLAAPLHWRDESGFRERVEKGEWIRLQLKLDHAELFGIACEHEFSINDLAPRLKGL